MNPKTEDTKMKNHEAIAKLLKGFGLTAAAKDCNESNADRYAPWVAEQFLQSVTRINVADHTAMSFPENWKRYQRAVELLGNMGYRIGEVSHTLPSVDSYNRVKRYTLDYQEVA